jgi:hypothetical protein
MEPKQSLVKLNDDQLNELFDYLIGSANTLDEGLASIELSFEQLDPSSFDNLYSHTFKCDWCGYWCDENENCGDQCCYTCAEEGKDMEDEDEIIDNEDNSLDDGDDA